MMINSNDSGILSEIKHFVLRHPPLSGNDKAVFKELFDKIAWSKGLNAGGLRRKREHFHLTDFSNSGKKYLEKLRIMLSWDILNLLIVWIAEENLSENNQEVVICVFNGSEVMDGEDRSELAEILRTKGLNNSIKSWAEGQLQLTERP